MKPNPQTIVTTLYSLSMGMCVVTLIWAVADGAVWASMFAICTLLLLCMRLVDQGQPCARCEAARAATEKKEGNA
jgi:FtsH-binding integral membrane protein